MPRSKRYSAYPYSWTMLIEGLQTMEDKLVVPHEDSSQAESQRQEWYAFLRALSYEAERQANTDEQRQKFADLHARGSQIAVQRDGHKLTFLKKSATDKAVRLQNAIEEQLGVPDAEPEPDFSPETVQDPGALDPFTQALGETFALDPEPDDPRARKDAEYGAKVRRIFEGWEEDEGNGDDDDMD